MTNEIAKEDVRDEDFVDAEELASDGYFVYRTVILVSTTSATRNVVISTPTALDRLDNIDDPLQVGDFVDITGTAAAGRFTVEAIVDPTDTFRVVESILDGYDGYADFVHPAGASKVGVDQFPLTFSSSTDLQNVLEDIDAALGASVIVPEVIDDLDDVDTSGRVHGSVFYFDGYNIVELAPATDGYLLLTHDIGFAPEWVGSAITGAGTAESDSLFSATVATTSSATFQDAFAGSSIVAPATGQYFILFDTEIETTSNSSEIDAAMAVNATFSAGALTSSEITDSIRAGQPGNNRKTQITCTTDITALNEGDTVHAVFRKAAGSGSVTIDRRRITMLRVS